MTGLKSLSMTELRELRADAENEIGKRQCPEYLSGIPLCRQDKTVPHEEHVTRMWGTGSGLIGQWLEVRWRVLPQEEREKPGP
ncbi:hypothetical protein ACIQUZ_35500 [Streptomyces griseus]|uniref:hypothetical protein n=1 Tax=Streptomyces griseus TaxID=1911 RepID=UPI003810DAF9